MEKKTKKAVNKVIDIKINNLFKNNSFFKLKSNNSLKKSQDLIFICLNSFLKVIDPQVLSLFSLDLFKASSYSSFFFHSPYLEVPI